ncbi:hypothetical protein ABPG72_017469 [Tetrahymena utriculariae]
MVIGTLIVRPKSAQLTYDTETFGKMDPFINVMIGSQKQTSAVAKDQGKTPVWIDQFNFKILNDNMLTFTIYDYDTFSSSDFIAEGSCSLANAFQGGKRTEYAPCMRKGKSAGQVVFEFEFIPDGAQGIPVQQGFPVQPGYPVQQGFPPQMGYPQQVPQGFPPQQNYPPQNPYPAQQYPAQQYPPQQFPPQQYPGQFPTQQYPPQQYPAQGYPPGGQVYPGAYGKPMGPQFNGHTLPVITFIHHCKKCHGSGWKQKDGRSVPCSKCYHHAGYCKKCCGTKFTIKHNTPCHKC